MLSSKQKSFILLSFMSLSKPLFGKIYLKLKFIKNYLEPKQQIA